MIDLSGSGYVDPSGARNDAIDIEQSDGIAVCWIRDRGRRAAARCGDSALDDHNLAINDRTGPLRARDLGRLS